MDRNTETTSKKPETTNVHLKHLTDPCQSIDYGFPGQVHQLLALPILHGVTRGIVMYWNGIDHPELPAAAGPTRNDSDETNFQVSNVKQTRGDDIPLYWFVHRDSDRIVIIPM